MRGRGALLVLVLLLAAVSAAAQARGPRIRVEPDGFDFGRVLPERMLRKEFRLRNLGDSPLVIERISRSCGCTEATTDVSTLEPGESTPLRVTMRTPTAPGAIQNEVLVRSNDAESPTLEIRLRATVVAAEK